MSRRLGAFCTAFLDILQFLATASFSSFLDFTDNLFLFFLCSDDGRLSFFFLFSVDDKELYSFSVDVGVTKMFMITLRVSAAHVLDVQDQGQYNR